ncbi:hypothetical protein PFISCL1PPCAC_7826, partial [Pristionchus fissidentatus]
MLSMVLMTIEILILLVELPLAPDDEEGTSRECERVCRFERAQRGGQENQEKTGEISPCTYNFISLYVSSFENSIKCHFNATSSGANGSSTSKMSISIVISTIDNPKLQSYRKLTFFDCA